MAKLLVLIASLVLWASGAWAQVGQTLSSLPQATTPLAGTESLYIVQGGVSKQTTVGAASTLGLTGLIYGNGASAPTAILPGTGVGTALAQAVTGSGGIVLSSVSAIQLQTFSVISATNIPSTVNTINLSGYYTAGDLGAGQWTRIATPSPAMGYQTQSADGAWWQLSTNVVNPFQLGAYGNNSTDDSTAEQWAIWYAQTFGRRLDHPHANYLFAKEITVSAPLDITSDNTATMRWTNSTATTLPSVSSITVSGTTATIAFASADGLIPGQDINLTGFTSANFNSDFVVLSTPSATTATFAIASGTGNASVIGTATIRNNGWLFDLRSAASNSGLFTANLPQMYSSGVSSSFNYQTYPSAWTGSGRVGDGVTMWGGSRYNVNIQQQLGWSSGVHLTATYDVTTGSRAPQNVNVNVNTSDICTYGVNLDGGASGAGTLAGIAVKYNTLFAKFPIYLNSSVNPIDQVNVTISGQAFTNEAGGVGIYEYGSQTNGSVFDINWLYAGYGSDSPTGTSASLTLPYVAGSNGSTSDGNATVGYFGGYNNEGRIGFAAVLSGSPGGELPASGVVTRIRDKGAYNHFDVRYYGQSEGSPTAMSTTQGEANFGAGVGSAGISKRIYVSAAVGTLTAGSSATFWFYHSFLSAGSQRPIVIEPISNALAISGLTAVAQDNSGTNNREGFVTFKNTTGSSITGATYYFWLEVMN